MADDTPANAVRFTFEGRALSARPGQSLAAALIENGERGFRETAGGAVRSVFCGMGVCQDCLVEIDGRPSVRACMETPRDGMAVTRQPARSRLDAVAAPPPAPSARVERADVLVIGGGAGGLAAAAVAARAGADVLLIDERKVAGGQYYKQAANAAPLDPQQRAGAALLAEAEAAGVRLLGGVEVWGAFDGPLVLAAEGADALVIRPRTTIVATGAYERPRLVPGWELPGVMTTGAAQTLWRSYRTLPGKRVLVAGNGPLNAQVALELAAGGASVAALVEGAASPIRRLAAAARVAASDPALALKGARMIAGLRGRGVPIHHGAHLARVEAADGGLAAVVATGGGERTFAVDAVLVNEGFNPSNEILRLLGCRMDWDARFRQLRPQRTADCETTVESVFAVGDCCGLSGAPAAVAEGRIAGAAAARRLGHAAPEEAAARRERDRAHRFQDPLWSLYAAPFPRIEDIPDETLLCRCEEVTIARLKEALATDPGDIGAAKRATRIGMGRCQGRYCGPALAALMADRRGGRMDEYAFFAPRPPVKPVAIETILAAEGALSPADGGAGDADGAADGPPVEADELAGA